MIDKLTVEKIYDAAQIVDVVSDFVTLKKRGVNFVGLCPFHEDRTPSFYVSTSKNICKCFACGEGGTPVQFIMKHEQVSYLEALRYLAKKYHIEVKERELSDDEKRMQSDRESMMIVNSWAQKFFTSRLYEHEEGQNIGMPYFVERGFREETIRKFQLGYAPNKWDDLYKSAIEHGFNETYLLKTGLVYKRDDGTVADRFHGRVIFPVHTLSGKVVAFGGRVLGKKDKAAKYVNSPESEIYHKSSELYGIHFARQAINKADKCFLVEGYTDVISMHQTGIENVVASSGTALTHGQIRLIRRFTDNITILYDGDAAGIKAAIRGTDMLLEEGMNVKIVLFPEGEDPDSFARSHNSFDFTLYIKEHEVDFIRFKADLLLKDAENDPIKRANLIKEMMETIAVIPDNIVRSVYIKECSHFFDEREQILIDEVMKIRSRKPRPVQTFSASTSSAPGNPAPDNHTPDAVDGTAAGDEHTAGETETAVEKREHRHSPLKKYESILLRYILRYGERALFVVAETENGAGRVVKVAEYIRSELQKDGIEIQTPIYRQILEEAVAQCENEEFIASHYFLAHPDLEVSELAADMISSKYRLSKYFRDPEETALQQTTISEEQQEAENEARKRRKERDQLERWIIHDLFTLKNAIVKHKIDDVNRQIKEFQSDEERVIALLRERIALDGTKLKLSKALGERIVTGIGK
ncbi:MAG: DNA primase [Tannerella sp.]|jgi:DNA primase|nr:DNA primase [Tannerella sp.]